MSIKQDLINSERLAAQQRMLMGAEKFDAWLKSWQIEKFTNFENFEQLEKFLKQAGFRIVRINTDNYLYIKTKIGGKDDCIYWLYRNGKIIANITVSIEPAFNNFIKQLEKVVGHKCFFDTESASNKLPEKTFPTSYTDSSILKEALKNIKLYPAETKHGFSCKADNCTISIENSKHSNYTFKVTGFSDMKKIHKIYKDLEEQYNLINQRKICENIKNKISKSYNMNLESEQILEDDSVLLTITI